jgi:hypothetical protein
VGFAEGFLAAQNIRQQREGLRLRKQEAGLQEKLFDLKLQEFQQQQQQQALALEQSLQQQRRRREAASASNLLQTPGVAQGFQLDPESRAQLQRIIQQQRAGEPKFGEQYQTLDPGQQRIDPFGNVLGQGAPKPVEVSEGASLVDPQSGRVLFGPGGAGGARPVSDVGKLLQDREAYITQGTTDGERQARARIFDAQTKATEEQLAVRAAQGDPMARSALEHLRQLKRAGATQVNVGPDGIDYGKPPTDTAWGRDAQGNILLEREAESGAFRPLAVPIKGSKLDRETREAAQKGTLTQKQARTTANLVTEDITRILALMQTSRVPVAGPLGAAAARVPGTAAADVQALLTGIEANISFDTLTRMRQASPTGGALGSVTDRELTLLSAAFGSLKQSQTQAQLDYNLRRVHDLFLDTVHGPGQGPPRLLGQTPPALDPQSLTPEDLRRLTPEQLQQLEQQIQQPGRR